jgi:hypothetical protein
MDKIAIELPMQAWNIVLNALGQRPYVEVADLLTEIKRQGESAAGRASEDESVDQGLA